MKYFNFIWITGVFGRYKKIFTKTAASVLIFAFVFPANTLFAFEDLANVGVVESQSVSISSVEKLPVVNFPRFVDVGLDVKVDDGGSSGGDVTVPGGDVVILPGDPKIDPNPGRPEQAPPNTNVTSDQKKDDRTRRQEPKNSEQDAPDPFSDIWMQVKDGSRKVTPDVDTVTGSLKYKYALNIPPGRNGLAPDISFVYSSDETTTDSYLGSGWSLSIPYIQKSNKTGSQSLYSSDYYTSSLSGDLVKVNSSTYKTKIENGDFLTYTKEENGWTVKDKTGTQYRFGSTSQAQQFDATTTTHIYKWMLEEVRDTNDNFISYEYSKDAGQIYPSKITYTGHATTSGVFEISFVKEPKTGDEIVSRTLNYAGFPIKTAYRITAINVKINGELVRSYTLGYSVIDDWAGFLLNNVVEAGRSEAGATTTLPAIDFNYELATPNWTHDPVYSFPVPMSETNGKDRGVRVGDINGDGLTDIVCYNSDIGNCIGVEHPYAYINDGTGWESEIGWNTYGGFTNSQGKDLGLRLVDVNGDGRSDLVKGKGSTKNVYIAATSTGWALDTSWVLPLSFVNDSYVDTGLRIDDINGDNLPDLVCGSDAATVGCGHTVYLNNGSGWTHAGSVDFQFPNKQDDLGNPESFVNSSSYDRGLRLVDINGDGLTDLVKGGSKYSYNRFVYVNTGSGWQYNASLNIAQPFIDESKDVGMRMADVNADGLLDIVCQDETTGQTCSQLSPPTYFGSGSDFRLADGWVTPPQVESTTTPEWLATSGSTIADKWIRFMDVDGDGLVDMIRARGGANLVTYMHNGTKLGNYLSQVVYPQGASTTISYDMTTELRNASSTLLNSYLPFPRYVVTDVTTDDGFGSTTSRNFSYENGFFFATSSVADRRFAGFGIVTETDEEGNKTKTFYHQGTTTSTNIGEYDDHISKAGKPFRVEKYDSSNNLQSKVINKWDKSDLGDGANFIKLAQTVDYIYAAGGSHKDKATTYNYNNVNGNLSEKVEFGEVTGGDDGSFVDTGTDTFFTSLTYATSSLGDIVLPSREKVLDYASSTVRDSKMYYDTLSFGSIEKGNLTKQEMLKSDSTYVDVEKTYNSYGLVTQEKDPRDKATNHTYDTFNLYPATTTNPLSQTTVFTYDYSLGKPKQIKDQNGHTFELVYDGLDRVIEEKQPATSTPNTLVTKTTYEYTDNEFPTKVLKTNYLDSSTSTPTYIYFDGLKRKVQERRRLEDSNTFSVRDTTYNTVGLREKESMPYSSSGSARTSATSNNALWNRFTYDALDRVKSIASSVGTTTNTYAGWKLTVTDANSDTKDLYKDARGNLTQVDEKNGGVTYTTYYEWDGNNNLTKITDAMGNVRNFTYDNLGRRTKAEDLHASTDTTYASSTFSYDDASNLTSMTNGAGQVVNYTYDDINRVLTEDFTGLAGTEVAYTYDTGCYNGIGRLCSATNVGSSTITTDFDYDQVGNLTKKSMSFGGGVSLEKNMTYDRLGNPVRVSYSDDSSVRYMYNDAGFVEKVKFVNSGTTTESEIISDVDYSPEGKITHIQYGNGVETTNTYDNDHLYRLTDRYTEGPTGGISSVIQDLNYTYDNVGNITEISDTSRTVNDRTVLYTYDDLSRLLSASTTYVGAGSGFKELFTYDPIGNITTKGNSITTYSYTGTTTGNYANPHAVTQIRTTPLTYDKNGNVTNYGGLTGQNVVYNYRNEMTSLIKSPTTTTYSYDHTGQRAKYSNSSSTTYILDADLNQTISTGTTTTTHIFLGGQMVATVTGTTTHYHHLDHLSGSNISTDKDGLLAEFTDYYPYGAIRVNQTYDNFKEQRKFTGHEYDADTSLTYMNARYYEGSRGQFLSQDPAFLAVGNSSDLKSKTGLDLQTYLSDPQGFNSYSYARNNPLKYVDQDGNFWQIPVAMAVIYAPQILSFTQSLLTPLGQIGVSQAIDDARSGNYGMAVIGGLTAGEIPAGAGKYIPTFDGLWTVGKGASRADNALYHAFQAGDQGLGHAQEFGLSSAKDYVTATRNFITNAINKGYMTKLESGKNFDILRTYDQGSDTFSVFEVNRSTNAITPRTMFTPDPAVHGKGTNLNYFNSQAGKAINIKKYFGK